MSKKLTYEFVKEQFGKEGYKLLSGEYINAHQKLDYICPKGHRHSISWEKWQQNRRCPHCAGLVKKDVKFIRHEFEKEGYRLLTTEYKNANQKLKYVCPNDHKHSISWSEWHNLGHRCPYCARNARLDITFVRSEFAKEDYELLTIKYKNAQQKLDYICPKGHRHSITWNGWQQGHRCYYCAVSIIADKNRLTIEFVKSEFEKEGYRLLMAKYKDARQKLEYICSRGHKHNITWNMWQRGQRCPECVGKISKGEVQVRNFIESLGIKVSANDRSQIFNPETGSGLELDIFISDLNKAIEYNGEYWHKDKKNRANNDLLKQQLCKEKDIDLLTIWDKKWRTRGEKCKSRIVKFIFD